MSLALRKQVGSSEVYQEVVSPQQDVGVREAEQFP